MEWKWTRRQGSRSKWPPRTIEYLTLVFSTSSSSVNHPAVVTNWKEGLLPCTFALPCVYFCRSAATHVYRCAAQCAVPLAILRTASHVFDQDSPHSLQLLLLFSCITAHLRHDVSQFLLRHVSPFSHTIPFHVPRHLDTPQVVSSLSAIRLRPSFLETDHRYRDSPKPRRILLC